MGPALQFMGVSHVHITNRGLHGKKKKTQRHDVTARDEANLHRKVAPESQQPKGAKTHSVPIFFQ